MLFTQFLKKIIKVKLDLNQGKRIYNSGKWYEQLNSNLSQSKICSGNFISQMCQSFIQKYLWEVAEHEFQFDLIR